MSGPSLSPVGIYTVHSCPRGRAINLAAALALAVGLAQPLFAQETKEDVIKKEAADAAAAAANAVRAKAQAVPAFQPDGTASPAGSATGAAGRNGPAGAQPGSATGAATPPRTPGSPVPGLKVEGGPGSGTGTAGAAGPGPDEVTLSAFSEAVELKTLVDYVAETLQINVSASDALTGSVVLNAPVTVKKTELLKLLDSLLEQQGFTIVADAATGWYKVIQDTATSFNPGSTTRVFPTPTIKPSSLVTALNEQIGVANRPQRISYMDELGVIVATDTPRRLDALAEFIKTVLLRSKESQFIRFELDHVAASTARQRVIELLGQPATGGISLPQQPGNVQALQAGIGQPGNIINLADRLSIDPAGNALIFRGYPDEQDKLRNLLAIIDRVNTLRYEQYNAGSASLQIAQLAERLGLGHVEIVDTLNPQSTTGTAQPTPQQQPGRGQIQQLTQQQQQTPANQGGPVMIVDTYRNNIIYYGTDSQHLQLNDLISKFDTQGEQIVIVTYKLKNKPSSDIADILNGVAFNQSTGGGGAGTLPGAGGGFFGINPFNTQNQNTNRRTTTGSTRTNSSRINNSFTNNEQNQLGFRFTQPGQASSTAGNLNQNDPLGGNDVFILADQPNNQIIVKAPLRQQEEFSKLIAKLDQRNPQVFIEVKILAISATTNFRLAIEQQWIAGQFAMNTNFGLGTLTTTSGGANPTTSGGFTSTKNVATDLGGLTAAIIKSEYVPITINALQNDSDTRILAEPQLLVDDNVEAEIVALDEQPTSTSSQTNSSTINTFGGYEQAGTRLTVTPSISDGGYLRLMYEIELSNFVGTGSNGFPPPKQTRNVRSDSVTIPGDATIIVGGIKFDQKNNTVAKIPLLGDIPLLGNLFRDTQKADNNALLYVFITPRIFRDPSFRDPILATKGYLNDAGLPTDIPDLRPVMIELADSGSGHIKPAEPSAPPPPALKKPPPPKKEFP